MVQTTDGIFALESTQVRKCFSRINLPAKALLSFKNALTLHDSIQERLRWEAFVQWNNHTRFFGKDDVIGFGDADEIPSRDNVNLLRHCEMAGPSVDIGLWFALGRLDRAFRPDWPVPGNPWTLGDPTFWTVESAVRFAERREREEGGYPSRRRGQSGHYLLGGVHMTDHPYVPFGLAKAIACTECSDKIKNLFRMFKDSKEMMKNKENFAMRTVEALDIAGQFSKDRFLEVPNERDTLGSAYYVPWFVQCNPNRYAGWHGQIDQRSLV